MVRLQAIYFLVFLLSSCEGIPDEELESDDLLPLLQSLRFFKARYVHRNNTEDFFYEALRLRLSWHSSTQNKF